MSTTFISADDGWALGTAPCAHKPCTSIVRTRDGGRTWQGIPAPRASESREFSESTGAVSRLRFADDLDGWAGVGELYSTHDGGATWHMQALLGQVSHVETGGGFVFVTTDTCVRPDMHCTSRVYVSPIGKDSWRGVARSLASGNGVSSLVVNDADWFAGSAGGVFHGVGMSTTIDKLPNPCPRADDEYRSPVLAVADAKDLDAACVGGGAEGSAQYELFGTTDGGRDWRKSRTFIGPSALEGMADNAHGVLVMAASSGGSDILRTTNDGKTIRYDHLRTPTGGIPWTDIGFTTPARAVAVLDHKDLYISNDAGHTFARVTF